MSKRVVILGSGESGIGAAILAKKQGFDVFVTDKGIIKPSYIDELNTYQIEFEQGQHTLEKITNADIIIKSPGIPDKVELIKTLVALGKEIISEIEWAYRFCNGKILAITGSNGKTTTTSLIYHILKKAGYHVSLGGNIGKSFARLIATSPTEWYVLELSSFQLDGCVTFRPNIAVLCNITEDHLDRYDYKFENYIHSKFSITKNQTEQDYFIYCADDPVTITHLNGITSSVTQIPFSIENQSGAKAYISDNQFIINLEKPYTIMPINEFALQGIHNSYNSMAAGVAAKLVGVRKETIRESLQDFTNLEHRLEFVATINGVDYINDSKATNVNSVWYALETMNKQVVWIVGGVDKGNDYTILQKLVQEKVKAIICLGKDNNKLHQAFTNEVGYIVDADSAQEAVRLASHIAESGDVVLLSPACASFDLFENYEDRGNQFKRCIRNL
ncbi:MAG: UDP-N-acetylmuramoyl-L-alanine--D-glutamate ligase [Chitinophagales bacterium]|nr:UDP-N-acetylmuramoyl-L-alanine--D-glutamate ligase [Chitinophagales bacterium]MCZ2394536.1 UDP-N-acetylmuramoyl-L-alanine--D-glutamate ligase [Chitinophagales bacterium]